MRSLMEGCDGAVGGSGDAQGMHSRPGRSATSMMALYSSSRGLGLRVNLHVLVSFGGARRRLNLSSETESAGLPSQGHEMSGVQGILVA